MSHVMLDLKGEHNLPAVTYATRRTMITRSTNKGIMGEHVTCRKL